LSIIPKIKENGNVKIVIVSEIGIAITNKDKKVRKKVDGSKLDKTEKVGSKEEINKSINSIKLTPI
jgi:hypothetical protein